MLFVRAEAYEKASKMSWSGVSNGINPAYRASRAHNLLNIQIKKICTACIEIKNSMSTFTMNVGILIYCEK